MPVVTGQDQLHFPIKTSPARLARLSAGENNIFLRS